MVHLPALSKTGNLRKMLEVVRDFNMDVKGEYGKTAKNQGELYQISNKETLGITEEEIINNLNVIIKKVEEQERLARKMLTKEPIELEDMVLRSYGVLTNCRKISYDESRELLSNIKLGTDLGILDNLTDAKVQKLYLYTKPANLQKYLGAKYDKVEQEVKRAEIIKQIINERS